MSFAIFYNTFDLQVIADYIGNPLSFVASQRPEVQAFIDAGLGGDHTNAPDAPPEKSGPPNGDARTLVIDGVFNNQPLTLARLVELCRSVAARGGHVNNSYGGGPEYLNALADDMELTGEAVWPPT